MNYLGLDVGTKKTGVAFASAQDDILFSLDTIQHSSFEELLVAVQALVRLRHIDEVVLGLPLLPSGDQGAQADIVLEFQDMLNEAGISTSTVDERYTTAKTGDFDKDAASACEILAQKLQRK